MKQIFKRMATRAGMTCYKSIMAALLMCASFTTASAQTQDGRNFGIDGFAAYAGTPGTNWYRAEGTTGGKGGKVVKADNFSQLQAYLQAKDPYIVIVDHDITTGIKCYVDALSTGHLLDDQSGKTGEETTYGERILIASNKTLIGVVDPKTGKAPLFSRITFVMQCVDNIIIRNCRFTMVGTPILKSGENKVIAMRNGQAVDVGDPDCIGIQADKTSAKTDWGGHIWIDHCEFFNGGAANKDRYDGLLDCKNNVQWMTFSYNYFHDHDKSCLWGKGGSDVYEGCRTISFHHNYFHNIEGSRLPLQRGGHVHYYNNYMNGCEDGWDVRDQAVAYEEGCYFKDTKSPIRSDRGGALNINKSEGYDVIYTGCNNLMTGYTNSDNAKISNLYPVTTTDWKPTDITSTYSVNQLDKTADVPEICEKYAGAGKVEIYKAYTDDIPAADEAEFNNAAKNYATAPTYTSDGKIYNPTAISHMGYAPTTTRQTYTLDGKRTTSTHGVRIVKTTDSQGNTKTTKVL